LLLLFLERPTSLLPRNLLAFCFSKLKLTDE
jgi:hypothetical protein